MWTLMPSPAASAWRGSAAGAEEHGGSVDSGRGPGTCTDGRAASASALHPKSGSDLVDVRSSIGFDRFSRASCFRKYLRRKG